MPSPMRSPTGESKVVPSLTKFGLAPTADLVFRALSCFGPQSAESLSRDLGISRPRVEDSLSTLRALGAVADINDGDRIWRACQTEQVIERLSRRQWARLPATARRDPAAQARRFAAVTGAVSTSLPLGVGISHLPSREATRARLSRLVEAVRVEHLTIHPEVSFDVSSMQAAAPTDLALIARGVEVRVLGVQPDNPSLLCTHGGQPSTPGISYRQVPDVPMKLIVLDRRLALFPVDPANYERGYLEVTQPTLVASLVETFLRHWGDPQAQLESKMPSLELTPREKALVALLAFGHTDTTAARELGISERSVSNIVRALMDRIGVDNRFQLGLALGSLQAAPAPPGVLPLLSKDDESLEG